MKYRKGFITNSSSSSFIGTFAKITDIKKAERVIDKYNLQDFVIGINQLKSMEKDDFCFPWCNACLLEEKGYEQLLENSKFYDLFINWYSINKTWNEDAYLSNDPIWKQFCDSEIEIYKSFTKDNGFKVIGADTGLGYY